MSSPQTTHADIALQYVRDELAQLRAAVKDDLAGVAASVDVLAAELRRQSEQMWPRIAVVEHRQGAAEADLAELKAQHDRDMADRRVEHEKDLSDLRTELREHIAEGKDTTKTARTLRWGLAAAVTSATLSWVPDLMSITP